MPTSFPTGLDSLPNPGPSDLVDNATANLDHDIQHGNANDAIEALEATVGITGSAVTTSHDYKIANRIPTSEKGAALGVATLDVDSVVVQEPKAHSHQAYKTIRYNGSPFTGRNNINFLGAGVAIVDDATNQYTQITINAPDVRTIVAASATTVNNSAVFTDVIGLTTPVLASEHWEGTAIIFYESSTTADIRYSLVVPTGATVRGIAQGLGGGATSEVAGGQRLHAVDSSGMTGIIFGGLGAGNRVVAMFNFRVLVSTTAGDIKFQVRQDTAEVSNTISQTESWMTVARIA